MGKDGRGVEADASCQTVLPQNPIFPLLLQALEWMTLYLLFLPPLLFAPPTSPSAVLSRRKGGSEYRPDPYLPPQRLYAHGKPTETPETPARQKPAF